MIQGDNIKGNTDNVTIRNGGDTLDINSTLIDKFRRKMNSSHYFVMNQYRNKQGKNLWNIICSSMDWIQVAAEGIPYIELKHNNSNVASLNLMQLLCAMDLIKESIHQLYRVFELEYPFEKDRSVFQKEKSDDDYFKHIRAVFGVHPVNLKGEDSSRYFASWSTQELEGDFSAYVYSNKVGVEDQLYSIMIDDLYQYTNKRYLLLEEIIIKVEQDFLSHNHKHKETDIILAQSPIDSLRILKKENMERYGEREAHWYEIEELQRLYSIDISAFDIPVQVMLKKYLEALLVVIEEIHQNLQSMNIKDLLSSVILDPFRGTVHSYDKEKLMAYLHDPTYNTSVLGRMGLNNMIENGELPKTASLYNGDELLIFLKAWRWSMNEKE